jgi:hypothetical protein
LRKCGNTPMLLPETAKFDSQKFRFLKLFQNLNPFMDGH